jgi:hypothetical protein
MTPKERLSSVISEANNQVRRIQQILSHAQNSPSELSYSDKSEMKELAKKFLINMNNVSAIIEPNQSLMMEMVPGFEGPVPAFTWMMWAMQWFERFSHTMKPLLDSVY